MDWTKHLQEADVSVVRSKDEKKIKKKGNKADDEKMFYELINVRNFFFLILFVVVVKHTADQTWKYFKKYFKSISVCRTGSTYFFA